MKDSFVTLFPTYKHDQISTGAINKPVNLTDFKYP